MHQTDCDLRQRLEQLARDLHDTRREVERFRHYRRLSPPVGLALCATVVWSLSGPGMKAQGTSSPSRVVAPFTIVDDKGQELVSVMSANGFARMGVGAQGGSVWLGTGASRTGFISVQRQGDTDAVAIGQLGSGEPGVHVMDSSGKTPVAELSLRGSAGALSLARAGGGRFLESRIGDNGLPSMHLGEKGGVWLGAGNSGVGFVMAQRSDSTDAVGIGARDGGAPGLHVLDASGKNVVAQLAGDASGSTLLVGSSGGGKPTLKVGATVTAADAFVTVGRGTAAGHVIRVSDGDGSEVATMGEARAGGGVFLANDNNGKTRMLMSGQGQLHAVDAAGVTRATVTADGAVTVRNPGNTTVVRIADSGSGNGMLQIANAAGNAMVEAGVLPTSEGVVRTYPLGGPPGTMIGMPGTVIKGWTGGGK